MCISIDIRKIHGLYSVSSTDIIIYYSMGAQWVIQYTWVIQCHGLLYTVSVADDDVVYWHWNFISDPVHYNAVIPYPVPTWCTCACPSRWLASTDAACMWHSRTVYIRGDVWITPWIISTCGTAIGCGSLLLHISCKEAGIPRTTARPLTRCRWLSQPHGVIHFWGGYLVAGFYSIERRHSNL